MDDLGDCGGRTPCYATIQAAIDAAGAGQTVRILPGEYLEQLEVKQKNAGLLASESDRITIEADPEAAVGSVALRGYHGPRDAGRGVAAKLDLQLGREQPRSPDVTWPRSSTSTGSPRRACAP